MAIWTGDGGRSKKFAARIKPKTVIQNEGRDLWILQCGLAFSTLDASIAAYNCLSKVFVAGRDSGRRPTYASLGPQQVY